MSTKAFQKNRKWLNLTIDATTTPTKPTIDVIEVTLMGLRPLVRKICEIVILITLTMVIHKYAPNVLCS